MWSDFDTFLCWEGKNDPLKLLKKNKTYKKTFAALGSSEAIPNETLKKIKNTHANLGCPIFGLFFYFLNFFLIGVCFYKKNVVVLFFKKKISLGVSVGEKLPKSAKNYDFWY
jgi:hypothetical protein